jgi:hypothetical protein
MLPVRRKMQTTTMEMKRFFMGRLLAGKCGCILI